MHQRQVIRAAVLAILLNATTAGARVYATRVLPYQMTELPVIAIYTLQDDVADSSRSTAPRELTRSLSLNIEAWVAPGTNVDDAMDDIALEIENLMHADPYLGDVCVDSLLTATTTESVEDVDRELGIVILTYDVTYRTDAPEAPVGMDDFNTADTIYQVSEDANDANDSVTVQVP